MKRILWALLLIAFSAVAFLLKWHSPRSPEFSLFHLDFHFGADGPNDFDAAVNREEAALRQDDGRGLSTIFETSGSPLKPTSTCLQRRVIQGARVVALGAYEGGQPVSLAFSGEGHSLARIAVQADNSGPPLLLILSAYDPVVWDFAQFPSRRLRGVLVYGYSSQAVAHIAKTVPVKFVTRDTGKTSCGEYLVAYNQSSAVPLLQNQVQRVLGVPLNAFYGSYAPEALHADGSAFEAIEPADISPDDVQASSPLQKGGLPPGAAGVQTLLERGAIRPAKKADWQAWNRKAGETANPRAADSFVILKPTELPRGMYGANSAAFLIPAGVPMPVDYGSHNQFYRLADGTCLHCE